jgi:hypothetical protein
MPSYEKRTEGDRTFFLVPLKQVDDGMAYLDCTSCMKKAIKVDQGNGFGEEQGPEFAYEIQRAVEYAEYVTAHATSKNLHKFNTRDFSLFINPLERAAS